MVLVLYKVKLPKQICVLYPKHRHVKAMAALEHPERALLRVESAIVMQSLVRRFLARTLVLQARPSPIIMHVFYPNGARRQ